MKILKFLLKLLPKRSQPMAKSEAADLIRRFISGQDLGDYEWDSFESGPSEDTEIDLALEVCLYYTRKFPGIRKSEYCSDEANKYLLASADALENGEFEHFRNKDLLVQRLRNDNLPEEVYRVIEKYIHNG